MTTTGTKESQVDPMEVILRLLEQNNQLLEEVAELRANGNGAAKTNRTARVAMRTLDTKTGKVYQSRAAAGMAVAPEFNLKVHNFVWYELVKGTKEAPAKCPGRFKDISEDEYQKMLQKQNTPTTGQQPATPKK